MTIQAIHAARTDMPTVRTVIEAYLRHTRREQSHRVYCDRSKILDAFADVHGMRRAIECKPFVLRFWVDEQPQWKSDWTKKRVISTIQCCFNWAARLGMVERNPFKGISNRDGEPGRAMTDEEFAAALRSSSVPFRRVLFFIRYTGCRPGECADIHPCDIDLKRSIATLPSHKTTRTRKVRKPRVIIMHPIAMRLIMYLLRNLEDGQEFVFLNSRCNPWNRYSIACRMKQLRKRGIIPADCKTYGLRHKFGTDAIRAGVELKTLSVLMGHTTTRCTERYVHIEDDWVHLNKAVQQAINKRE